MGMPGALIRLRKRDPQKFREACRRGGKAAAARKRKQREQEEILATIAARKAAQEEVELRRSTNEHILSADGEPID